MVLARREKLIMLLSLLALGLTIFFVRERTSFINIPLLRMLYFSTLIPIGLSATLLLFRKRLFPKAVSLREEFRRAWPLLLYYLAALVVLVIAYFNAASAPVVLNRAPHWWVNRTLLCLVVPFSYFLGVSNRRASKKYVGYGLLAVVGIGIVSGLGELAWNYGYENPFYSFWYWWKNSVSTLSNLWFWDGKEAMRIAGFSYNPAFYSYIGIVCLVWTLSARKVSGYLRLGIGASALVMVGLSGSRASLLIAVLCIVVSLILSWKEIAVWVKEKLLSPHEKRTVYLVVCSALAVVLIASFAYLVVQDVGAFGRVETAVQSLFNSVSGDPDEVGPDILTGRGHLWTAGWEAISAHPFGAGLLDQQVAGRGLHNAYLSAWVAGGPAFFVLLIMVLVWMVRLPMRDDRKHLPLLLGIFCVVQGFIGNGLPGATIAPLVFFLLGVESREPVEEDERQLV